jgi:hypothetical protein
VLIVERFRVVRFPHWPPRLVKPYAGDMAASLPNEPDDLLITDELHHRIAHKADYQREKLAIQDLARQMAQQPDQVLPHLVHLAMELCGAHSAGISLYEAQPPGPGIFRWRHLAGRYAKFLGGSAPRDFSPSGVCFDVGHANSITLLQASRMGWVDR